MVWRQQLKTGEPADVAALFGCSVGSLPGNVCLIGCTSAVGCFGAHIGDPSAVLWPDPHYLVRQHYAPLFADVVANDTPWEERHQRGVDVHLGRGVAMAEQLRYRYLLDVDGFTRTWDAWAWKMMSGSVVLSPALPWESYFSRQFEPWEHFVPVANDFSDLGRRLEWCREHDAECREIAERARRHAVVVYAPETVARIVAETWPTDG